MSLPVVKSGEMVEREALRRAYLLAGVVALAGTLITGCADGQSRQGTSPAGEQPLKGGLRDLMTRLSAAGPAAEYLEYGDMAHWRALGAVTDQGPGKGPWQSAVLSGFGDIAMRAEALAGPTGINAYLADRGVIIGTPPNTALRVEGGIDAGAVHDKLVALGAKPRTIGGQEGLSMAADHAVSMDGPLTRLGLLNQLNQVVVTGEVLAAGSAAAPVAAALGGDALLSGSADHTAVADCLGDVAAATILAPAQPGGVKLYGVGLRKPAAATDQPVNVVCVLPRIAEVGKTFTERFTGDAKVGAGTLSALTDSIDHDQVGTAYRATMKLKPGGSVMLAHQLMIRNELAALADPAAPGNPLDLLKPTPS